MAKQQSGGNKKKGEARRTRTPAMAKPSPVMVWWVDSMTNPGWCSPREVETTKAAECVTVGWLIEATKADLLIASSRNLDPDAKPYLDVLAIPRGAVSRMRRLRE